VAEAVYPIRVPIDPTEAIAARNRIGAELEGLERQAGQMQAGLARAFDFTNIRPNFAPITSGLDGIGTKATAVGATLNRELQFTRGSSELTQQLATVQARVAALEAQLEKFNGTGGKVVVSAGQQRAAMGSLGQQFNDFATQVSTGINPLVAFQQQSGQTAYALSQLEGGLGSVGRFLAGPFGTLLLIGGSVLAQLAYTFFTTEQNADAAEKATKRFADRQNDMANFVDRATGALVEQNKQLVQNAILKRQAQIDDNNKTIREQSRGAFRAANTEFDPYAPSAGVGTGGAPLLSRVTDPRVNAVIQQANGDVAKLSDGLFKLAQNSGDKRIRDLALRVSNIGGEAILAARDNAQLSRELDVLSGKTRLTSTSFINSQVAMAEATTAVERAQLRLRAVQERGAAAEKNNTLDAAAYRKELTDATRAVNAAEAAQKSLTAAKAADRRAAAAARREEKEANRYAEIFRLLEAEGKLGDLYGIQLAVRQKQLAVERQLNRPLTDKESERVANIVKTNDAQKAETEILARLRSPLEEYQRQISALNALLDRGKISQAEYNAELGKLPLAQSLLQIDDALAVIDRAQKAGLLTPGEATDRRNALRRPGTAANDNGDLTVNGVRQPQTEEERRVEALRRAQQQQVTDFDKDLGGKFGKNAARDQIDQEEKAKLERLRQFGAQRVLSERQIEARITAVKADAVRRRINLDRDERRVVLSGAADMFGSLADIAAESVGKQSAAYKALFAVSKAFAIADSVVAIQQGIAKAIALGFPQNIPVIAGVVAQGASIIANITAVAGSFANGGMVQGQGGPRDDNLIARVSAGEFIVNAEATRENRPILEAINRGQQPPTSNDNGPRTNQNIISIGDVHVNLPQGYQGGPGEAEGVGMAVKDQLRGLIREELAEASRDGGQLTQLRRSAMTNR